MGSKVVAGVAMTNLPGIVVLAFAKAQLIQIFFFRLNLIITLVGLATWVGPPLPPLGTVPCPRNPSREDDGSLPLSPIVPTETQPRAGAEQGVGLALSNPCFEDKDKDKDKDEATAPRQG
ncbi:NPC1-like intracellular cholesterol transporter 1 [Aquila chrysaetos chrysaetos]|uniref:NPC1-like intracellular cholesterol transporter 1 n=1 Tax=Aquila chrysaetos chrysaetos TaxID=223781 RepID=UPI0011768308|nr:NPC1-like intracellular cholesterol transporter 1 [Aquila chrysaetos chrysaetos]